MAKIYFDVDNLNEVLDSFKKMEDEAKITLHAAVNKGAQHLAPLIKSKIKVGNVNDIHVRDSVRVSKAKPGKALKQTAYVRMGNRKSDYAFHLETGTSTTKPQPVIRATTDQHQEKIADIIGNEILDRLGL